MKFLQDMNRLFVHLLNPKTQFFQKSSKISLKLEQKYSTQTNFFWENNPSKKDLKELKKFVYFLNISSIRSILWLKFVCFFLQLWQISKQIFQKVEDYPSKNSRKLPQTQKKNKPQSPAMLPAKLPKKTSLA